MLNRGAALVISFLILLLLITGWYAASLTQISPMVETGSIDMGTLTGAKLIQTNAAGNLQYQGTMQTATELNNGDIHFNGFNMNFFNHIFYIDSYDHFIKSSIVRKLYMPSFLQVKQFVLRKFTIIVLIYVN